MQLKELVINSIVMSNIFPVGMRSRALRYLGVDLGANTFLGSKSRLKGTRIKTGEGCFINHGCHFDRGPLTLGDQVFVGPGVTFVTQDHVMGSSARRAGANVDRAISVGSGTWIGANVTVLGGVNIASGCIIAAGAVVTKDTAPDSVYGGVPARLMRRINQNVDVLPAQTI